MLRIVYSLKELDFAALMAVYEEGNRENGAFFYPELTPGEALRRAEQDFYDYLKQDFFHADGSLYALWEVRGAYVSALRLEPYRDGYLLEALETAPDKRGKGYAKRLMGAFLTFARDRGMLPIYSHVRKGNVPSQRVHSACGFTVYKDLAAYIDGSVDYKCNTWKFL